MLRRNKKSSKRNLKPFRRFDEVRLKSSLSSYEWFIAIVVICEFLLIMYMFVRYFL